jgi:signal transduction histidine kinase
MQRAPPELAPSPELTEALLMLAADGVASVRAGGSLGIWTAAAERLSGRSRAAVQRMGLAALFGDRNAVPRLLAEAARARGPVEAEVVLRHADRREIPVRLRAMPFDGDVLLVLQDLSEVHTIRRRLIETEKLSAMARIAASVAHEFRNPLNSLFLSADLLEDELSGSGALGETIAPTLAAIREEVERLNHIITHYLALSKIGGASRESVDLVRFVEDFAREWREKAAQRATTLRVRGDTTPALVQGDPQQLRRALVNLVENALDAVGSAGRSPRRRPGLITLSVKRLRGAVRVAVRDNGAGLPSAVQERLFEPFTSTKPGGAGLGLYLVREIARAHGGSVAVSGGQGRGTRVALRLPAVRA